MNDVRIGEGFDMLHRRAFVGGAATAGLALGLLGGCRHSNPAAANVRLFLNWFYTSSFAGDVLAARDFAPSRKLNLDLQVGGEGRDPIRLVRDGDIGVASADEILRAVGVGAPIAIIGVLNDIHPAAFVSLAESGVKTPKDFEGKRIGMLPFGATGLVYQALLRKVGVDRSKVTEVIVSPDLRPFISGRVNDVQPIFMYDEPVSLEDQHVAYNLIDPRQYGVEFKGQCYFTTKATLAEQPDLVVRTLEALLLGWAKAADDPGSAVEALRQRSPALDTVGEGKRLKRALPFFVPSNRSILLGTAPSSWNDMIASLVTSGVIGNAVDPSTVLQLNALEKARAAIQG